MNLIRLFKGTGDSNRCIGVWSVGLRAKAKGMVSELEQSFLFGDKWEWNMYLLLLQGY